MGLVFMALTVVIGFGYLFIRFVHEKSGGQPKQTFGMLGVIAVIFGGVFLLCVGPGLIVSGIASSGNYKLAESVGNVLIVLIIGGIAVYCYQVYMSEQASKDIYKSIFKSVADDEPTEEELEETRRLYPAGYIHPNGGYGVRGLRCDDVRAWRRQKAQRMTFEEMIESGLVDGPNNTDMTMYMGMYRDLAEKVANVRAEKKHIDGEIKSYLQDLRPIADEQVLTEEEALEYARMSMLKPPETYTYEEILAHYRTGYAYKLLVEKLYREGKYEGKYKGYIEAIKVAYRLAREV